MNEIEQLISETITQLNNVEIDLDFLYREDELERLEEIRRRNNSYDLE